MLALNPLVCLAGPGPSTALGSLALLPASGGHGFLLSLVLSEKESDLTSPLLPQEPLKLTYFP